MTAHPERFKYPYIVKCIFSPLETVPPASVKLDTENKLDLFCSRTMLKSADIWSYCVRSQNIYYKGWAEQKYFGNPWKQYVTYMKENKLTI